MSTLTTVPLGTTDMAITRVGFGAWAVDGGGWAFAWGPQDDAEAIAAIRHAIEAGINWIDTAAVYGLGHSIVGARSPHQVDGWLAAASTELTADDLDTVANAITTANAGEGPGGPASVSA
jgi:aryl-alcohol dehydrogenase-like predicted oxidoreductase